MELFFRVITERGRHVGYESQHGGCDKEMPHVGVEADHGINDDGEDQRYR